MSSFNEPNAKPQVSDSLDVPAAKRARAGPDLKIVVDDGELEVRSQILEFASPVFAKMLNSAMTEGSGTSIKLPGKNKSELEAFCNSLHICSMRPLTKENAMFLAQWADEYQIDALKNQCEEFLIEHLPVDAAAFQHAVKYGLQKRTKQCLDQMKEKLEDHVNDLQILIGRECQEHLAELWPLILQKAGLQDFPMPPSAHLESMWPFLAEAIAKTRRLEKMERDRRDMRDWPSQLFYRMPPRVDKRAWARNFLQEKLQALGAS